MLATLLFVGHVYGPAQIVSAAQGAELKLLFGAGALGYLMQIVRAHRSQTLLARDWSVSLFHSFAAMVVGHGIGDLLPLAPGGPVLRSVLTERLAGVPVAFSGGAYMIEGTLDVIAPAFLIPYILWSLPVPTWAHWILLGIAMQATLLLALTVALALPGLVGAKLTFTLHVPLAGIDPPQLLLSKLNWPGFDPPKLMVGVVSA
jgi:hypothetical protein